MDLTKLTQMQKDVLREIGNIGAGNAATSMSQLVNRKIEMDVPAVNIVSYDEMMELIGGPEAVVVALLFRIKGDAPGTVYFILSLEEADALIKEITNNAALSVHNDDELAASVLQEAGNIVTGAYLSALADFTNITMQPSVPYLSIDMAGAILTVGLLEISQVADYALIIDAKMNTAYQANQIKGNFLFIPDPDSFSKLFAALGVTYDV
ncbi:CheY-P phosphatase CheC [Virgibacillus pantothenticus]|uniref:Chemotaxis protein CheY n=1 Tax=Virgibacillus pantothenticus TaxID=1473 RepID=A0A0L0QNM1_VIRPA|nr:MULTISPECIES: chemotaxis protein CheC [Virgibacillus]API93908.1 CheY-P-specific phosphatase CheC [Virgibacillus sp. 6R]KNE20192.1 chemotaxis protein CheY [Virgibacillus pantothenticus]MBS7427548.1 chemotaxis protein CheC [Virgibacillus sp. 19R1-5]MBU8565962.1 chemotaxis protein CheC [Virgibacillus pantothenticus]MBU8600939.1 chemotaxis protein CheC [Virgibacillus pantothenticus]